MNETNRNARRDFFCGHFFVAMYGNVWYNYRKTNWNLWRSIFMRTIISIILMVIAALVGFFFGAGMNEAMGGAILLSMIIGFACTISAIEKNKKE